MDFTQSSSFRTKWVVGVWAVLFQHQKTLLISNVSTRKDLVGQDCSNYISFRHGNGLKLLNDKEIIFLEENRDILFSVWIWLGKYSPILKDDDYMLDRDNLTNIFS